MLCGGDGGKGGSKTQCYTDHQTDFCMEMSNDESHFNVSFSVRDTVARECP